MSERESHLNSWSHHHAELQHHQNDVAKTSTTDLLRSRYVESWRGWLTMVWDGGDDEEECGSYGGWKIWKRGGRRSRIQKLWGVNCFTPFSIMPNTWEKKWQKQKKGGGGGECFQKIFYVESWNKCNVKIMMYILLMGDVRNDPIFETHVTYMQYL